MHGAGRVADAHCYVLYVMYVAVLTIALLVKGHLSLHGSRTVSVSQQRHSSSSSSSSSSRLHSKTGTSDVVDVKPVKILQSGMRYRRLPHSELVVSELCLGTMNFGDQLSKKKSFALLDQAVKEHAINFIDTAESYPVPSAPSTTGKSERIIGEWLKAHGGASSSSTTFRESIVLSTKICGFSDEITWCRRSGEGTKLVREQIIEAVDAQLARLGTDYIDLLQFHWPDRYLPLFGADEYHHELQRPDATPILEQLQVVAELIRAGKVRSFGLSNETPFGVTSFVRTAELLGGDLPRVCSVQNAYNLLEQNDFQSGMLEVCAPVNADLAVLAYSPLAGGALTGKYLNLKAASQEARMKKYIGYMYRYIAPPAQEAVRAYSSVAAAYDLPLSALSSAWVYSRPAVTSTIIGASSPQQLSDNVQALNLVPLSSEVLAALKGVHKKHVDPTKGRFDVIDPSLEYVDPSKLPWGAKDQDVDPELDLLINQRLQN